MRAHMAFLASDALNGRGSGTRDEWIAATYLGSQLALLGLEPMGDDGGFVQKVEIDRSETTAPPVLTAGGTRYVHGAGIVVQSLGGERASGPLRRYVEGLPLAPGAVVLMPPPAEGSESARASQTPPAATPGAALVLVPQTQPARARRGGPVRLPSLPPRFAGVQSPSAPRPTTIALDAATYAAISGLADGAPVSFEASVKPGAKVVTWNAVGRIPGSDPAAASEVILLSAHLDHVGSRTASNAAEEGERAMNDTIYNGADDDASGTVAVLELANALMSGPRPRRTIVIAFFGSEEAGGYGSRFFTEKPVVPLAQIVANLQFEMIGRPDSAVQPHTLWLTGYERSTLGPALAKQGARLVQDPHPDQSFFTRSDNIQLARRGVIAHTVSSFGLHQDYHQPSDELRTIDFVHMTDAIRSMLAPIRWLADSGFRPEWLPGMKP